MLDGGVNTCYSPVMPNKPDADKHLYGIRLPRDLWHKIKKLAAQHDRDVKSEILSILMTATIDVSLTSDDYEQIRKETKAAELRNAKR